jgi:hypothetical protein
VVNLQASFHSPLESGVALRFAIAIHDAPWTAPAERSAAGAFGVEIRVHRCSSVVKTPKQKREICVYLRPSAVEKSVLRFH